MNTDLLNATEELNVVLRDFKNFLYINSIDDKKCLDYISYILEMYDISKSYVGMISFDSTLKSNGLFNPCEKKLSFNIEYLKAAYKLKFITESQLLYEYFHLILHELNHILQYRYKYNYDDEISKILKLSDELKIKAKGKYTLYYDLFPDEIDSNIRSANIINELELFNNTEKNLIEYLIISMRFKEYLISSQIHFLCERIINKKITDTFSTINPIFYGTCKDEKIMNAIIKSYQSQKLCVDIDRERRLLK